MHFILIILLCVAAAIVYGIIHDQITARVCVEYFTIAHPPVFNTNSPTLLAFGWGIIATWWVGLILGLLLAIAARAGHRPKRTAASLIRPIVILLLAMGTLALVAGITGHQLAMRGNIQLYGWLGERVPLDRHARFIADLWAHSASYLGGSIGGLVLAILTWRSRKRSITAPQTP